MPASGCVVQDGFHVVHVLRTSHGVLYQHRFQVKTVTEDFGSYLLSLSNHLSVHLLELIYSGIETTLAHFHWS